MPEFGGPKKNMNGPLVIGPVGQLIELYQSNDPQVWLAQYASQRKRIRCRSINSSDNISGNFHTLLDSSLFGSGNRLSDIGRSDEDHTARLHETASGEKHCLPDELAPSIGRPSSRFIPATRLPFHAKRCLLRKSRGI
jgi:hypothetical protein